MIAQELKIGDWVLVDGEPTILTELANIVRVKIEIDKVE